MLIVTMLHQDACRWLLPYSSISCFVLLLTSLVCVYPYRNHSKKKKNSKMALSIIHSIVLLHYRKIYFLLYVHTHVYKYNPRFNWQRLTALKMTILCLLSCIIYKYLLLAKRLIASALRVTFQWRKEARRTAFTPLQPIRIETEEAEVQIVAWVLKLRRLQLHRSARAEVVAAVFFCLQVGLSDPILM